MWFDGIRQPNTIYVADISHGKDSTAMLRAIQILGFPLDVICTTDMWATKDVRAELPPMVQFKDEWDKKCQEYFGLPVTHVCAHKRERDCGGLSHISYEEYFYRKRCSGKFIGSTVGFPMQGNGWCRKLKYEQVDLRRFILQAFQSKQSCCNREEHQGISNDENQLVQLRSQEKPLRMLRDEERNINIIHYFGIAADEPKRIARHIDRQDVVLPLVQIGWDEDLCGLEATYMDMLSPTYEGSCRDGCWFCHNQGVPQLRNLRRNYPDLWALLLKWDNDSPVTFHADGHTVHDFDRRFQLEDDGLISPDDKIFRWSMLDAELNYRLF